MKARAIRLQRLSDLREKQHDAAALALRRAHGDLHAAEADVQRSLQAAGEARQAMAASLESVHQNEWLLACAHNELCSLHVAFGRNERVRAVRAADEAARVEREARLAAKQMETTLGRLKSEAAAKESRAEQQALDEAAGRLRMRSSIGVQSSRAH